MKLLIFARENINRLHKKQQEEQKEKKKKERKGKTLFLDYLQWKIKDLTQFQWFKKTFKFSDSVNPNLLLTPEARGSDASGVAGAGRLISLGDDKQPFALSSSNWSPLPLGYSRHPPGVTPLRPPPWNVSVRSPCVDAENKPLHISSELILMLTYACT